MVAVKKGQTERELGNTIMLLEETIHNFVDHQKPQAELDGKACAAVRQNGLMALYDTLFSQVDQWFIIGPSSSFIRTIIT
ncbi:putative glutamate-5-semialdehyde dehydrogenase, Glutamate 5-kinase [Helianthus annuus]|nr:putative glutamate-5-semialdehyde dehydrogenase, Glutamate 5-kinase [Helianthus annuus]KAJ0474729.1 putative glutamate-5-semialdehyde dehydrogenase, Glutamate 5-kinase [Helianthus annuus]KAJ0650283.1 putative glutamate-5-semialdehyde dehydrogenase, Glutamate 5-kinase [Helianthus annuus]